LAGEFIYGRNAARECLRARRRHIHKLWLADNLQASAVVDEILNLARQLKITVQSVSRKELDKLATGHQGVVLETGRYPTVTVGAILQRADKLGEPPFIIVLDHIEDPHNLGAMLRTAEAVGIHGVVTPKQRAATITPAVVNVSAGAAEHIWVAEVPNLTQTLKKLKEQNIWIVGLEKAAGALAFHTANLTGPIALVVGSEGQGLARLVRENCDFLVQLPMRGRIESLNASVACGLILYEVWRARGFA
jgi:23S rRNA (guanosine2251-2'-O)-methyltransferase